LGRNSQKVAFEEGSCEANCGFQEHCDCGKEDASFEGLGKEGSWREEERVKENCEIATTNRESPRGTDTCE
jgi:hypothetical protein